MDEDMEFFLSHEKFGPPFARRDVPEETLAKFQGKLPKQLLQYWREYGWCGYGEGLFWTVDPDEWAEHIAEWLERTTFFARDTYHVIGRTAFGKLYLWGENTGTSIEINPAYGLIIPSFNSDVSPETEDFYLRCFFSSRAKGSCDYNDTRDKPLFERAMAKLGPLDHHTMYGYVPALALGGKESLAGLQKLEAHTHLNILAQVTELTIMPDVYEKK